MRQSAQLFSVRSRVAIITGGNGQLGTEYAKALAAAGARVAIFDTAAALNPALRRLAARAPVRLSTVDITDRAAVRRALREVERRWGTPQVLINNAALDAPPGARPEEHRSFEAYPLASWQRVLDVNLTGTFICCQVIGSRMARRGRGSIINISSTYGLVSPNQGIYAYRRKRGVPFVKPISYSATKSATLNLTRYLATYWARRGVRVNTLVPGGVFNNQDRTFLSGYHRLVPMGRMARKDEMNGAVLFLASDASSYMTGATLVVDGGWTAW